MYSQYTWCRGVFFPQCSKRYLSYILIAFFDVLCSTNDELMNVVYFCFLSWRIRWTISLCTTMHRALNRVPVWNRRNPAHLLQDFLSKDFLKSWDLYHLPFDLPGGYKHWHEASNENNVASIYKPFQMMLGEHLVLSDFFITSVSDPFHLVLLATRGLICKHSNLWVILILSWSTSNISAMLFKTDLSKTEGNIHRWRLTSLHPPGCSSHWSTSGFPAQTRHKHSTE